MSKDYQASIGDDPEFEQLLDELHAANSLNAYGEARTAVTKHIDTLLAASKAGPARMQVRLTAEDIDEIWNSLDGQALIAGKNQMDWNRVMRIAFGWAIESALTTQQKGE